MSMLDIAILLAVFSYVWGGLWTGLIQAIGGLVGLFLGGMIASRLYDNFGTAITPVFNGNEIVASIFAFALIFLLVTRLVGVAFYLVHKMFNFFAIVPGLKMLNRLGGALFGFLEGGLFIGIFLQFISRLPISDKFAGTIAESQLASYFLALSAWLVPLFPGILKNATNAVDKYLPE